MADEIKVKVGAETAGVERGLAKASGSVREFKDVVDNAAKTVIASTEGMQRAMGEKLIAASTAMANGMAGAAKFASTLERNMIEVGKTSKLTGGQIQDYTRQVLAMSASMKGGKDAVELSFGLRAINQQGVTGAKSMGVLRQANIAAAASMEDIAVTAAPIASVLAAYGFQAEEAGRVNDVLFKTIDRGNVTFKDFQQGLGSVAGIAAPAGVSLEEVGSAVALLTQHGIPASQAMTIVERAIVGIAAPAKEAAAAMTSKGIAFDKAAIQGKGLGGILTEIVAKTGGNIQAMRELIPSTEALQLALALTKDKGAEYRDMLGEMTDAHGSAQKAMEATLKGTQSQWDEFLKTGKNAATKFGLDLLPTIQLAIQGATGMAKAFEDASPETRRLAEGGTLLTASLGGLAGTFLVLSPAIASLPQSLVLVRGAIAATTPNIRGMGGYVAGLAVIVGSLYLAWEKDFLGIQKICKETADTVVEMVKTIENTASSLVRFPRLMTAGQGEGLMPADLSGLPKTGRTVSGMPRSTDSARLLRQKIEMDARAAGVGAVGAAQGSIVTETPEEASLRASMDRVRAEFDSMLDKQQKASKMALDNSAAEDKKKKHVATEEELRRKMIKTARDQIGTSTYSIRDISGLGDASNQCANTMRLISKNAGMAFGVDTNPFDKQYLRNGEGVGSAHADSLFGNKVGKYKQNNPAMGDMVFFEQSGRPGVVGHVGMVSGNGNMIHASSSRKQVVESSIADQGQRVLGYISPNVYGKGGTATEDEFAGLREEIKKRKESYRQYVETDLERQTRDMYEEADRALSGASTDAERSKVKAVLDEKLRELSLSKEAALEELGRDLQSITEGLQRSIFEDSKQQFEVQKTLGPKNNLPLLRGRESTLDSEIQSLTDNNYYTTMKDGEKVLFDLLTQRKAINEEIKSTQTQAADEHAKRILDDFTFEQQMGRVQLEDKRILLEQELINFQGSQEQKRAMQLELHQIEMSEMQERYAFADEVFAGFSQSLQGMLTQSLSSQQSFGQSFQSMWKSVANSIIAEITKMIIKALALQAIMRGIFGFFNPIGAIAGGGIGASVAAGIPTFHDGGPVGGGVLAGLQSSEVLAILKDDETVLTGDNQRGILEAGRTGGGGNQITMNITVHNAQGMDERALSNHLYKEIESRLKGV